MNTSSGVEDLISDIRYIMEQQYPVWKQVVAMSFVKLDEWYEMD